MGGFIVGGGERGALWMAWRRMRSVCMGVRGRSLVLWSLGRCRGFWSGRGVGGSLCLEEEFWMGAKSVVSDFDVLVRRVLVRHDNFVQLCILVALRHHAS